MSFDVRNSYGFTLQNHVRGRPSLAGRELLASCQKTPMDFTPMVVNKVSSAVEKKGFPISFQNILNLKFVTASMAAIALVFLPLLPAFAIPSGGRSGGSSFRSSSSGSRSSGSSSYGGSTARYYGSSYSSPNIIIAPSYGFGFNPFFGFGYMPINFNVLLLAMAISGAYYLFSSRVGGSSFSNDDEDSGSLGSGATVIKLQIGLDADWSDNTNIMRILSDISTKQNSLSTRSAISSLLSDAAIALLRKQSDWNSATCDGQVFNSVSKAEPLFQRISVSERTKFEKETNGDALLNDYSTLKPRGSNTQAVVSLVVAIRGKSDAYLGTSGVRSVGDVRKCLQSLASEALTDEGENVMGVEVLWTPSETGMVLSEREIVTEYPELMKI
eukprot:gene29976-39153_t